MSNKVVLTPDELVLRISTEIKFHKGLVDIPTFLEIVKQNIHDEALITDVTYMKYLVGNVLKSDSIVLMRDGKAIVNKKFHVTEAILEPENNYKIGLTEEKLWELLVGKLPKECDIGAKGFELLLDIASCKEKGIDAISLTKRTKQDVRSLTGRLKKLDPYIFVRPFITKGAVTKHITYIEFASESISKKDQIAHVSVKRLAAQIVSRLKFSKNQIRQVIDLRRELGFDSETSHKRRFLSAYTWLNEQNYIKKIIVCSGANDKKFHCLQYIRDYELADADDEEDEDEEVVTAAGEGEEDEEDDDVEDDVDDNTGAGGNSSASNVKFENVLEGDNLIIEDVLTSNNAKSAYGKEILFNTIYTDQSSIGAFVESKGTEGATTMETLDKLFGKYMKNPFYRRLETYVTEPQDVTTPGNGFRIVRVIDFQGRKKFYRLFSESAYRKHFLQDESPVPDVSLAPVVTQTNDLNHVNKDAYASFNPVLGFMELEDGSKHHVWHHHLDSSMKLARQKRKKAKDIGGDLSEAGGNIKKPKQVSTLKPIMPDVKKEVADADQAEKKNIKMGDLVGYSYRSIQLQQALLSIVKKNGGIYLFGGKNYQEDIAAELGVKTVVDKKTMKRDIAHLKDTGKIQLVQDDTKLYIVLPEVSKERLSNFLQKSSENKAQPTWTSKWEVSNKNELTFFDANEHNKFYRTKAMKRIAAYQEKENQAKKQVSSDKPESNSKRKHSTKKIKEEEAVPVLRQPVPAVIKEKLNKGKVNVHTREGVHILLQCCIISQSIKKKIEWTHIAKLFTQDVKILQKVFISKKKQLGSDYFKEERVKWRRIMINAVREDLATVEDAENLNLKKLLGVWKQHQEEVQHKTVVLYKDIKRNHQKYGFVERKAPSVFELSIAKSSMTKRLQTLMRKPFTVTESADIEKDDHNEEKIRSVIRSLLIEGKDCEIEIAEKYLTQYTDDEFNRAMGNLVRDKVVALNGNSKFHLTDIFNEFMEKHDQLAFFQNVSKFLEKFKNLSKESLGILLTDEPQSTIVAGCFDLFETEKIHVSTIPSLYTLSIEEELDYVGKKTRARSFEEPLIIVKSSSFDSEAPTSLTNVPGLGIPYSKVWINGDGQVRGVVWKKLLSMLLFQLLFSPGITKQVLCQMFSKVLSVFEVEDILQWYLANRTVKTMDGEPNSLIVNNPFSSGIFS